MIILKYRGSAYIRGCTQEETVATSAELTYRGVAYSRNVEMPSSEVTALPQCPQPRKYRGSSYLIAN